MALHPDQLPIHADIVQQLIQEQFPHWADLAVRDIHSEGTVNAIFRVGSELAARFQLLPKDPSEAQADLEAEFAAGGELAAHVSTPVSRPVALGLPGAGYPMPWSIQNWLPGTTALHVDVANSIPLAQDLATLIAELRAIETKGRTFSGRGRGGGLQDHDEWMAHCFTQSEGLLDVPVLRGLWRRFRDLPDHSGDVMCHGDLTPGNILVADGRLTGLLDVCGLGAADPALDLVSAWHCLEDEPRAALRAQLRCNDVEWERGKAWAFQQAMGLVWYYESSHPAMSRWGRRTLEWLMAANASR